MSKLECTLDNRMINVYGLDKERITIGRKQSNDIIVDNLSVSGEHASITTIGKDSFIEDAGSTNGTIINLRQVKKQVLKHGDVIEIGRHHFTYVQDADVVKAENKQSAASAAAALNKAEATSKEAGTTSLAKSAHTKPPSLTSLIQMSRPMKDKEQEEDALSKTTPMPIPAVTENVGKLEVLNGSNAGKIMTLNKTMTTFGKAGVQVVVITKREKGYFLSQVEGNKKPLINDKPLSKLSQQLIPSDSIEISGIKMKFNIS